MAIQHGAYVGKGEHAEQKHLDAAAVGERVIDSDSHREDLRAVCDPTVRHRNMSTAAAHIRPQEACCAG